LTDTRATAFILCHGVGVSEIVNAAIIRNSFKYLNCTETTINYT